MIRRLCWLLLIVTCVSQATVGAKIYRSVGSDGVVLFSDVPTENAKAIVLQPAQFTHVNERSEELEWREYELISIVQPITPDDQGKVSVDVFMIPGLQAGDRLEIYVDEKKQSGSKKATTVKLTGLSQSEHYISARVVDENGSVVVSSEPVRLFVGKG